MPTTTVPPPPDRIYRYFSMVQEQVGRTEKQIVHLHTTRGWGLANVLAGPQQAGHDSTRSLAATGGIGGQPANFVDGVPVAALCGAYYYKEPEPGGFGEHRRTWLW